MSVESESTPAKDVSSTTGETVSPAQASSPTEPIAPAQSLEQSLPTTPTPTSNAPTANAPTSSAPTPTADTSPSAEKPAEAADDAANVGNAKPENAEPENAKPDSENSGSANSDSTGPDDASAANAEKRADADGEAKSGDTPAAASQPSKRIQIGSQRGGDAAQAKPKPVMPVTEAAPQPVQQRKHYPPPNVRDKLSPEMEAELEAALGGDSVDSILGDAANDATNELAAGTKVKGQVAKIHGDDIFLEVPGTRHQGVIPVKQFEKKELPEIGAQLEATVSKFDAEQGLYEMSLSTAAVDVGNWDEVSEGQVVDVMVDKANKGGLECKVSGIRGFIPMGQISIYRIDNAEEYVGQKLTCVITEVSRKRKNLVLSHRALMERERKENREKLMAELAPGQLREGVVRSLQDFGAFVDLGGADGLVHISQLSWDRIGHPSEVLQVGEKIKVKVEKVNQESGKIALSYREAGDNPWKDADSNYPNGSKAKGTVTKLMQFGAFVKLQPGVEGLIHISELGHGRVHRTSDVLSEGQEVEVQVLTVDTDAQKIGLSLKALMPKPEKPKSEKEQQIEAAIDKADEQPKRKRKHDPNLKGGIGGPTGGEQFGLKW